MIVLMFDLYFPDVNDLWDRTHALPGVIVFPYGAWGAMVLGRVIDPWNRYEPIDTPQEAVE